MTHLINFKEIVRWANRNRATTVLSISGMAIGIAIALLIGFWSLNEFSFDKFHKDADRIYRVCRQGYINNESTTLGSDFGPMGTTAKEQFPEIEDVSRVVVLNRELIKIGEERSYEEHICSVDQNFFKIFSFQLETGDSETSLNSPDKIVIDRSLADKYFRGKNPVGQIIEIYGKKLQVSAVLKNIVNNSHLKFNMLIPISAIPWLQENKWGSNDNFLTYVRLKKNANTTDLAKEITRMTYQHFPLYEQIKITHFLQPLTEIHFSSGFRFDYVITNDQRIVVIFISLAVLILLIASFNFINLFISTSFLRAKSIGIKKINGCSKTSMFVASYAETTLYILVASCLAFLIFALSLPAFNQIAGSNLKLDFGNNQVYLFTGALLLVTILIAGTIPVLYILRFNPEEIIRNRFRGKGVTMLQRVLVISQFVASIILISSAGIIQKQIKYVQHKNLGFDKEHIVYVTAKNLAKNYETIRQELLKNPNILDVTAKNCLPFEWNNGNLITALDNPTKGMIMETCYIKYNYADLMKIPLVAGRNPFTSGPNKSRECLINEQAAANLGLTDPIGKQIRKKVIGEQVYTIAGVLKNANTKTLHLQIDPQIYLSLDELQDYNVVMLKTTGRFESAIQSLEAIWNKNNPEIPLEYHFLDEDYDKLYQTEEIASKIISAGMIIALFLAFMGLYAISHYATERRIKEIGIRKVNGAKISEVLVMLNKDFVRWILLAVAIATPVTWFVLHKWLENFAYKTSLSWWIFALSGIFSIGIALLTVSWQSWKAATRNPVEALRYE